MLLATAKLNGGEPFAYLNDVVERLSTGHPMSRLDDLLTWNWARSKRRSPTRPHVLDPCVKMDGFGKLAEPAAGAIALRYLTGLMNAA